MAWWNREELEQAGLDKDQITAMLHSEALKTRVHRAPIRNSRGKLTGRSSPEVQVWIERDMPLDAASFRAMSVWMR